MAKKEAKMVKSVEKDFNWYLNEAEKGDAAAQDEVGEYYYEGKNGVEKNFEKAFEWYMKAALQGYAKAQNHVGWSYDKGEGVKANKKEAFKWFLKAAEQGYAKAQSNVGNCYCNGWGIKKDEKKAFDWYMKAAEQGYANAQIIVACCYDNGDGVKANKKEAFNWWMKAAEQGCANAQFNVGCCYDEGEGVKANKKEARKWWMEAAKQGNIEAQNKIDDYKGVKGDKQEASRRHLKVTEPVNSKTENNFDLNLILTDIKQCIKQEIQKLYNQNEVKMPDYNIEPHEVSEISNKKSTSIQTKPEEPKAFIIMQFKDFDDIYKEIIIPICNKFGYEPLRADSYSSTNKITQDIVDGIKSASFVIAEITPDNLNVFYELGYAHALNKKVILLADKDKRDISKIFDIKDYRAILYQDNISGTKKLERELSKFIEEIKKQQDKISEKNDEQK